MKMIKYKYTISLILAAFFMFSSCEENFLERLPKDQVSTQDYWKTPKDLRLYVNQFYPEFPGGGGWSGGIYWFDTGTDNMIHNNYDSRLAGTRTIPSSGGGWDYENIRNVNYFFENYQKVDAEYEEYKQYVGEAYFFRAYFYFQLVKSFGDVPYYSGTLTPDSEGLYAPRTPRQQVVDSIVANLDKAIEHMSSGPNSGSTRLNKEIAQLFKSRVCLYEATWEKYHDGTKFGVSSPKTNSYLQMAAAAAEDVINSGHYSIYETGSPSKDYLQLFNRIDYSDNPEVMLWEKFSQEEGKTHNHQRYIPRIGGGRGITKHLVDDYLCSDGDPTAVSSEYQGDNTLSDVMANRDPRLNQTVFEVGDPQAIEPYPDGDTTNVFEKSDLDATGGGKCPTGYQLRKGGRPDPEQYSGSWVGTTGSIIFRYAEVLLNYAEAKAELGTITQADVNMTINKLRERVGMPDLNINNITTDPDWLFPDLSPILNEIRRERRVELACEGYRWDDLARWRAHEHLVGERPLGINFDPNMYPDMVIGTDVYLNDQGYVDPYKNQLPNGYEFDPNRDYLNPIPTEELSLNEDLVQNPGWD